MPTQTRKTCTSLYLYVSWQCGWTSRWSLLNRSQSLLGDFHEALTLSPIHSSSRRNFRSILKPACRHSWKISMRLYHPWSENKVGSLLLAPNLAPACMKAFFALAQQKIAAEANQTGGGQQPPRQFSCRHKKRKQGKAFPGVSDQRFSC